MWKTDQLGLASWSKGSSLWRFDARGGEHSIAVSSKSDADNLSLISIKPVATPTLPKAGEQFIRGDSWNVNYPQVEDTYALRLAFEPIDHLENFLVLEVTLAMQTDLLDSHPKLDIEVDCQSIKSIDSTVKNVNDKTTVEGSAPISIAMSEKHSVAVLLGPQDSPFTTSHSTGSSLRLRLFGDFLEKGVIRKARPWIVLDRTGGTPNEERLTSLWKELCNSPLPLA